MAVLDPRSDVVVIRIVYDGAPLAGKSTSVRALGKSLGAGVVSPGELLGGRTLYFDWLDYTGGLFEGRRIRCQIISVPGQTTLAPRRRRLIESADAIVFVADSSPEGFEADRGYLGGLRNVLERLKGPPVGVVLQANKRDLPAAVPIPRLRSMLEELGLRVGVLESVATDGTGIREAFVFAVRLALDRVRELMRIGELRTIEPRVSSALELLTELRRGERRPLELAPFPEAQRPTLASQALMEATRDDLSVPEPSSVKRPTDRTDEPAPPDERVGSGMIWPPVNGRTVLQELGSSRVHLSRSPSGDWSGVVNKRWRIHSSASEVFHELEVGRSMLVQCARTLAARFPTTAHGRAIDRCVVLAADGHGSFRLWQIHRIETAAESS
jgi:hypothetical protein